MNVDIGAEAPLFPEKEYIKGIFVAVLWTLGQNLPLQRWWNRRETVPKTGRPKQTKIISRKNIPEKGRNENTQDSIWQDMSSLLSL